MMRGPWGCSAKRGGGRPRQPRPPPPPPPVCAGATPDIRVQAACAPQICTGGAAAQVCFTAIGPDRVTNFRY